MLFSILSFVEPTITPLASYEALPSRGRGFRCGLGFYTDRTHLIITVSGLRRSLGNKPPNYHFHYKFIMRVSIYPDRMIYTVLASGQVLTATIIKSKLLDWRIITD